METNLNQSGIYAITSPSGKRYVGSAVNIRRRWREHKRELARGNHHCKALQHAHNKYNGEFVWSVLLLCHKEELTREEQAQFDMAGVGTLYNSAPRAGSTLGVVPGTATRQKMSLAKIGKKYAPGRQGPMLGRKHSEASKQKMCGRKLSEEHAAKLVAAATGRVKSADEVAKILSKKRGRKLSNNSSGYVGVTLHKRTLTWDANVRLNKRLLYLGSYPTPELANQARQNFDRILRFYDTSWSDL
uniref:GIY-YIG nuclease n=1 Tax=Xanthomonas phage MK21 TaxID=3148942 RepID=A0AAU7J8D3_9CAUD